MVDRFLNAFLKVINKEGDTIAIHESDTQTVLEAIENYGAMETR